MTYQHHCDLTEAIHVSRAKWVCATCGEDVSLMYLLWCEAREAAKKLKEGGKE